MPFSTRCPLWQIGRKSIVVLWLVLRNLGIIYSFHRIFEAYKFFVLRAIVADTDHARVDKFNDARALCHDLRARVAHKLAFDARPDNRSLAAKQRHCLTHHVPNPSRRGWRRHVRGTESKKRQSKRSAWATRPSIALVRAEQQGNRRQDALSPCRARTCRRR